MNWYEVFWSGNIKGEADMKTKRNLSLCVLVLLINIFFLGCVATLPKEWVTYEDSEKNITYGGLFSIQAPNGPGWVVRTVDYGGTLYVRQDSSSHSCIAGVFLIEQANNVDQSTIDQLADNHFYKFQIKKDSGGV